MVLRTTVTALGTCWKTNTSCARTLLITVTFVMLMLILWMNVELAAKEGINTSPGASGNHPMKSPMTTKTTRAGVKTGWTITTPGTHAHTLPMSTQRPKWNGAKPQGSAAIQVHPHGSTHTQRPNRNGAHPACTAGIHTG